MRACRRSLAAVALVGLLALPGCKEAAPTSEDHEPYQVEPIEGSDVMRVTLDELAADQIELQTTPVTAGPRGLFVPESAIWIDVEGQGWVYTNPEPLTFVRAAVEVDRFEHGRAVLSDGPPAGTEVVSVGVPELIGSEFGV